MRLSRTAVVLVAFIVYCSTAVTASVGGVRRLHRPMRPGEGIAGQTSHHGRALLEATNPINLLPASAATSTWSWSYGQGVIQTVAVAGQPGVPSAVQIQQTAGQTSSTSSGFGWDPATPVAANDTLVLSLSVRCVTAYDANGCINIATVQTKSTYTNQVWKSIRVQPAAGWTRFDYVFRPASAFAAGALILQIQYGLGPQTLQVGGIALLNYGKAGTPTPQPTAPDASDLPSAAPSSTSSQTVQPATQSRPATTAPSPTTTDLPSAAPFPSSSRSVEPATPSRPGTTAPHATTAATPAATSAPPPAATSAAPAVTVTRTPTGSPAPTTSRVSTALRAPTRVPTATEDPCPRGENGICYFGGDIMTAPITLYYLWYGNWDPKSTSVKLAEEFAGQFIGGSQWWKLIQTYSDAKFVPASNNGTFGKSAFDKYSFGTSVKWTDMTQAVINAVRSGALPSDPNGIYMVMAAQDVDVDNGDFCRSYCAYHSWNMVDGVAIKHGFVGHPERCPDTCLIQKTSPNSLRAVESMLSMAAHEWTESVTDWDWNGWWDKDGNENADKCMYRFSSAQWYSAGYWANVALGSKRYLVQDVWVNANGGYCADK